MGVEGCLCVCVCLGGDGGGVTLCPPLKHPDGRQQNKANVCVCNKSGGKKRAQLM